jgi:uncharacterized membrane protein YjjP (DUF1212 family)
MIKALLFTFLFAVVGLVAFAFIGPLFIHGADANKKAGAAAFPVIVLICGGVGFVFGLRRKKKP